jgi:hypothetical protein
MRWASHLLWDTSYVGSDLHFLHDALIQVYGRKVSEIRKRGFAFERGRVVVHIFRVDQASVKLQKLGAGTNVRCFQDRPYFQRGNTGTRRLSVAC